LSVCFHPFDPHLFPRSVSIPEPQISPYEEEKLKSIAVIGPYANRWNDEHHHFEDRAWASEVDGWEFFGADSLL
jgi:hypothetical protein